MNTFARTQRSPHLWPRERVGPYTVIGNLGGRAGARLGRRDGDGKLAVLRTPLDPSQSAQFLARARAVSTVQHPALVPILEIGRHHLSDGTVVPFVAEEYRVGGSLRELLGELSGLPVDVARTRGRDRMPGSGSFEARASAVGARIGDALEALHAAGLAHGAVRPSAILFDWDSDGEVFVALGGFRLDEASRWSDGIGYAAPECVEDHGPATQPADLIGLAATLYELLALHPAFDEDSAGGIERAVREREPERPSTLQPFLRRDADAVLLQAMEKYPWRRPRSAADLARDLRALASGRPVSARMPSMWRRSWRRLYERRRRLLVLIAILAPSLIAALP